MRKPERGALRELAAAVLRANDAGRWTIPASRIYPHQWNWDSALCAVGWAEIDGDRAWTELESLVGARDRDGMLPHIAFRARERGPGRQGPLFGRAAIFHRTSYLPGAAWWGDRRGADGRPISGITQPPLAATCMRLVLERAPDERRAARLLAPLHAWHRFLLTARDPDGIGEPVLVHPWESGRDNAPEWDVPLARVHPRLMYVRRRDTAHVDAAERPSNDHYRRFLTLVARGTEAGWPQRRLAGDGPFRVLDTAFSAILARACLDLAEVARAVGEDETAGESEAFAARVGAALARRAAPDGSVPAVDLAGGGASLDAPSVGSVLAVLAPGAPPHAVERARLEFVPVAAAAPSQTAAFEGGPEGGGTKNVPYTAAIRATPLGGAGRLASPWGVRSYAAGAPGWSPRNYWRGPVWANLSWLAARGLEAAGDVEAARALDEQVVDLAGAAGMREYVDPASGRGLGAGGFSWTAALTLRELARR